METYTVRKSIKLYEIYVNLTWDHWSQKMFEGQQKEKRKIRKKRGEKKREKKKRNSCRWNFHLSSAALPVFICELLQLRED